PGSVDDDDPLGRPVREGRPAHRGDRPRGARGESLWADLHRRGSDGDARPRVRGPRGERVRGIPRPPRRLRDRRGGRARPRPAATLHAPRARVADVIDAAALIAEFDTPLELRLRIVDVDVCVRTNDATILARLQTYYEPYLVAAYAS